MDFKKFIIDYVFTNSAYAYRLPLSKNFQDSASTLKEWTEHLEHMNQSFKIMDFSDTDSGKSLYELIKDKTPDEEIQEILKSESFISYLGYCLDDDAEEEFPSQEELLIESFDKNKSEDNAIFPPSKELLEVLKELISPGRVLDIATYPFKIECLETICKHEKNIIDHKGRYSGIFHQHKELFDKGLAQIANFKFPKGDTIKLAEFMTNDETFSTFLDDYCDRESENLCNTTLPQTIGNLTYNARKSEQGEIEDVFMEKAELANALNRWLQINSKRDDAPLPPSQG